MQHYYDCGKKEFLARLLLIKNAVDDGDDEESIEMKRTTAKF